MCLACSRPLTLYALEAITTTAALSGVRLLALALKDNHARPSDGRKRRVVLVGAGEAASLLIREMQRTDFPWLAWMTTLTSTTRKFMASR